MNLTLISAQLEKALAHAEATCKESGGRLTAKRKNVLRVLLDKEMPLSAYEIADIYKETYNESLAPMSVYRMLQFLIDSTLVHKLSSTNKFIACSHISCKHSHQVPQFLICDKCDSVEEVNIDRQLIQGIEKAVVEKSFILNSPQFELHGLCLNCQ